MEAFARFVVRFRVAILVVSALMTVGAAALMTRLKVDTDFANYISPDDPIVQRVRQAGEVFGSSHTVVVLVESKDSFAPEIVQAIARLTKGFRNEPGVSSVMSLTNIVDIKKTASGLEVADLVPSQALGDPAALAELKRYTQGKSSYSSFLVSADCQFTAIYINIAENAKKDEVAKKLRVVTETLWPEASRPAKIHFAGEPMIMNYLDRIIVRDMVVLVPLVVLLLLGILYFSFRTLRGVVLPMLAVLMATVVTFGIMGLAGSPLTIIAAIMPVVLISNGSAYGIHMLNFISLSYDQTRDSAGAVKVAMGLVTVPIMNSAITTFIGFMSFVMGLLTIFESFGIYTAIGIAASLLFAVTFIPAVICCLKPPAASAKSGDEGATAATFLSRPLAAVAHMIHDHPRAVLAVAAATTLAAAPGIFRLQSDFDMLSFFKETSEPRQADALMTREFGGTMAYMIHVRGPVKDPLVLGEIYRLQKHLRHTLGSTRVNSIADVIAEMNDTLNGVRGIPATRAGIESLYLLMEGKNQLNQLVTPAADQALITGRLPQVGSAIMRQSVAAVDRLVAQKLRPQLVALPYGAVAQGKLPELGALVADELLLDLAVDLAAGGRTLGSQEKLRPLLAAAVGHVGEVSALSVDDRRRLLAAYLSAEDCDLAVPEQAQKDQLTEVLAALGEPTADNVERQICETVPALAKDAEGVKLAAAAVGKLLSEEATRRDHERLLTAILSASAPAGEATGSLAAELRGQLGRLAARYWPVTPAQYTSLTGQVPPSAAVVSMTAVQAGPPLVSVTITDRVAESQIYSLGLCLLLVLIVMVIQLRSFKGGAISMLPIVYTLIINFGLMGWLGVTLNIATMLIASLAIGIGIDYTIHTAYRIRIEAAQGGTLREVLERVFLSTGRAVLINALAVMAGFLVIVVSQLTIIKYFGGMTALAIGLAAIAALTIYPVLVMTLDRRYITPAAPAPSPTPQPSQGGTP